MQRSDRAPPGLLNCLDSTPPQADSTLLTVYTIRLTTGLRRGAALSEPDAGVWVALVGADGGSLLQRCCPINDPHLAQAELQAICDRVASDSEAGANCPLALAVADAAARSAGSSVTRRFQEGSVDEFVFVAPELGTLAGVLLGPEAGSWYCDEVNVASSRAHRSQRFVCRDTLGGRSARPAAWLTPVPAEAVVYGSGDAAVILSKEQAAALRSLGMAQYDELKGRLLLATASLVAMGTGVAYLLAGLPLAVPFVVGGGLGVAYQLMLQQGVDALPLDTTTDAVQPRGSPLSSSPVRLVSLLGLACAAYTGQQLALDSMGVVSTDIDPLQQVFAAVIGFLMYKVAVIGVTVVPAVEQPVQHEQQP